MVINNKTKKLKIEFKKLETDLLKTKKIICDLYQKVDYLDKDELKSEIQDLFTASEINIVNEHDGFDDYFVTSFGSENKINRPAFVDKYGNCLVQGYREVKKD